MTDRGGKMVDSCRKQDKESNTQKKPPGFRRRKECVVHEKIFSLVVAI